ncbi:MAG: hypothetical protein WDN31_00670 [Hyphomicrobium sp.]
MRQDGLDHAPGDGIPAAIFFPGIAALERGEIGNDQAAHERIDDGELQRLVLRTRSRTTSPSDSRAIFEPRAACSA